MNELILDDFGKVKFCPHNIAIKGFWWTLMNGTYWYYFFNAFEQIYYGLVATFVVLFFPLLIILKATITYYNAVKEVNKQETN